MKTLKLTGIICILFCGLFMASCSDDDSQPNNNTNPPTGELTLFAIDTAKVNVMSRTGANETTIINKMVNSNSYFSDLSVSPDGTMIAYTNYQASGSPTNSHVREVRVANIDGTNDHMVYSEDNPMMSLGKVRFCSDNKIFFVVSTSFPDVTRSLKVVNVDGTGLQNISGQYDVTDVSDNRKYYLVASQASNSVTIIDKDGDGGAGGLYHNVSFTQAQEFRDGVISNDGSVAVIPFKEGNTIKARVVNMAAKTHEDMTLISGLGSGWTIYQLELAADNKHGVVTVTGQDYTKSKSYVFNIENQSVDTPFENNDENVYSVYIR